MNTARTGQGIAWRRMTAWEGPAMGGRLAIVVTLPDGDDGCPATGDDAARSRARAVGRLLAVWASRLTRFDPDSELSRLNDDPAGLVTVGPTLAGVLDWARAANDRSGGIVDVTLLGERLAAERGNSAAPREPGGLRGWDLRRTPRGARVARSAGVRFDLDGVAKGWLADRALARLPEMAGAIVDADGDIAIRLAPGDAVDVGIADPRHQSQLLACLRLEPSRSGATFGVATSGISVHRWAHGEGTHHLIDPRTLRPAATDVLQASVLAATAREAEVLAKTAVILGRDEGFRFLEAAGAMAAVVLTADGECLATQDSVRFLGAA